MPELRPQNIPPRTGFSWRSVHSLPDRCARSGFLSACSRQLGSGHLVNRWFLQFHPADNLAWAAPAYDDSNWEAIQTERI